MKPGKSAHTVIIKLLPGRLLWLEAKRENGSVRIVSGGTKPVELHDDLSFQDVLKTVFQEVKSQFDINWFAGCEIILAAPCNIYTARHYTIPSADENTVREAVAFEVAETLQIPVEETAWAYHISTQQDSQTGIQLIWTAARKSSISTLLSTVPKNTLYPTQISPEFWAVYETLLHRNADLIKEPSLIAYNDGSHLNLIAADNQTVYFTRSVGITGKDSDSLNHTLQTEIQRLIEYIPERFETGNIQNVILCGLNHVPADELRQLADRQPFSCIHITTNDMDSVLSLPSDMEHKPEHFPMLCIVYSTLNCNLPGMNLMDEGDTTGWWETITSEESLPPKPILQRIGMLAGAVFVLWLAELVWFQYAAASYLEEGKELLRISNYLQDEETALRSLSRTHVDYDELFVFLSEKLPNDVIVKSITLDTKSGVDLVLAGGNNQMIQPFVEELNKSKFFRDMTETRSAQESSGFTLYLKGKLRM